MQLLKNRKALVFGVANERSIAYAIAKAFHHHGASIAFSHASDRVRRRIEAISQELDGSFILQCDVSDDRQIAEAAAAVKEKWGSLDILVHSLAFAKREDLGNRFIDTSRDGFRIALDVSAYSLVALCRAFEPLFTDTASVITLSYLGAQRVIPNYNVMGVAKAALESSVRYLAPDLGARGVRVNAISAGPVKTLAASAISDFKRILDHVEERSPLGRNIAQEEVGNTALFLASDLSSGITGEVMNVDAGFNVMGL